MWFDVHLYILYFNLEMWEGIRDFIELWELTHDDGKRISPTTGAPEFLLNIGPLYASGRFVDL